MKKVMFAIAVVVFFTACGSKTKSCETTCDSTKVDTTCKVITDSIK
jgi:hypothetical protein